MNPGGQEDLDRLYGVDPAEFTALRKEMVAAANKRGDREGARAIGAARRPTTAAWVVNSLVRAEPAARTRLEALSRQLRAAHADMAGARIRELTATQRRLVDELARTAFAAAGVAHPSAALRDDVTGTLQAAVADAAVSARLGRLEKAERWSGFNEFGSVTAVGSASTRTPKSEKRAASADRGEELAAARERLSRVASEVEAADAAHRAALEAVSERTAQLATARRHYEELLDKVDAAEQALDAADERLDATTRAATEAVDLLTAATAELENADAECQRLAASTDNSS